MHQELMEPGRMTYFLVNPDRSWEARVFPMVCSKTIVAEFL